MEIQNNDRIKQLIVRYVKGELSEGEMDELKRWRDERAEHEELFRNVVPWNDWRVEFVVS